MHDKDRQCNVVLTSFATAALQSVSPTHQNCVSCGLKWSGPVTVWCRSFASGLVGSEESDLGFPLHPEYAIQTYADWYFLHGIFG